MKQNDAKHLWNYSCMPILGSAQDELVLGCTSLFGVAIALEVPPNFTFLGDDTEKHGKVANLLREWADAIEGRTAEDMARIINLRNKRIDGLAETFPIMNRPALRDMATQIVKICAGELDEDLLAEDAKEGGK